MKQPKRLTLDQKKCLSAHNISPKDWAFVKETEFFFIFINRRSGIQKMVDKFKK